MGQQNSSANAEYYAAGLPKTKVTRVTLVFGNVGRPTFRDEETKGGSPLFSGSTEVVSKTGIRSTNELEKDDHIEWGNLVFGRPTFRDEETKGGSPLFSGSTEVVSKTRIRSTNELKKGDHIAWNRGYYYHHALVVEVCPTYQTKIKVIHYGANDNSGSNSFAADKATIKEEWVDAFPGSDPLYRYNYDPDECYPSDVVIENARERLGESKYNLLGNNCEHFARLCKTGRHESYQCNKAVSDIATAPMRIRITPGAAVASEIVREMTRSAYQ